MTWLSTDLTDAAVSAVSAYQNTKLVASFLLVNHLISKEHYLNYAVLLLILKASISNFRQFFHPALHSQDTLVQKSRIDRQSVALSLPIITNQYDGSLGLVSSQFEG